MRSRAGLLVVLAIGFALLVEFRTAVAHFGIDLSPLETFAIGLVAMAALALVVILTPELRARLDRDEDQCRG